MSELKVTELLTGQDFKDFYFVDSKDSFCEIQGSTSCQYGSGFLEIVDLDVLNKKRKPTNVENMVTRQRFYTITFLTAGEIIETIGSKKYHFKPNTLFFIPQNQLNSVKSWSDDVRGIFCMFDADYFLLVAKQVVRLQQFPFYQLDKDPFVELAGDEVITMKQLFSKLQEEKCFKQSLNDDTLTRMFLNITLMEAERIYANKQDSCNLSLTRGDKLVAEFQRLVSKHFIEKRLVSDYADLLHVHPNHLNSMVKDASGVTASVMIQNQLIEEAKSRILQSTDSISAIALQLNFKDESYFGRFFKKLTRLTPLQFRKLHKL